MEELKPCKHLNINVFSNIAEKIITCRDCGKTIQHIDKWKGKGALECVAMNLQKNIKKLSEQRSK